MGVIRDLGDTVYSDYATAGIPASGPKEPYKPDIRRLIALIDAAVATAQAGLSTVSTLAARDTFYTTPANQGKLVYVNNNNGSPTDPANGVYEYVNGTSRFAQGYYQGLAAAVQPLVTQATTAAAQAVASATAALAGSPGVFGGPSVTYIVNPDGTDQVSQLSRQVWVNPARVIRDGIVTAIAANVRVAGPIAFGFIDDAGAVQLQLNLTFTTTGPQSVSVAKAPVRKGWRFAQLSDGSTGSALIGYSAFGYSLNAPATATNATNVGTLSVVQNVTIAAGYTLDSKDRF